MAPRQARPSYADNPMRSPVLFLIFNRPAPTHRVFAAIRAARPPRLYIAADGARANRPGEQQLCEMTRQVASNVDWPCAVNTLFRDKNLGCKHAVSGAIDWFFGHEPEGVILEDDCLPNPTFFPFCDELLEKYRLDERIAMISGDNFQFGQRFGPSSYYFTRYCHIWGWASWRRSWLHYQRDADCWPHFRSTGGLRRLRDMRLPEIRHWSKVFADIHAGRIDTWDYQVNLMAWSQGMVSIAPQTNLVENIGFGTDATHTIKNTALANLPAMPMVFPLQHPISPEICVPADQHTSDLFFCPSPLSEMVGNIRSVGKRLIAALSSRKMRARPT